MGSSVGNFVEDFCGKNCGKNLKVLPISSHVHNLNNESSLPFAKFLIMRRELSVVA